MASFFPEDDGSKFLTVPAAEPEHRDGNTPPDSEEEPGESGGHLRELDDPREENKAFQEHVSAL